MKTIKKNISHKKKLSKKKGIYGYGRKRNNSRLKMKNNIKSKNNIKRKRSILRGGAFNTVPWRPSKKFSNVEENENTALKEYIFVKELYVEKLKKYHPAFLQITYSINGQTIDVYNNNFFRKYVFPNGNIYYVYPNKTKPEDPIIYSVFECTNQSITIETDINLEHTITLTPLELSVDTMQLSINTGSLQIIEPTEKDPNTYLGFVNFPSLVINKVSHSYKSSRKEAIWLNVYEDAETLNYNIKQSYVYKYHSNYQNKVRREEDKNKGNSNTVKRKDEMITFENNAEYFNEMKTKIKEKMLEIQNNSSVELKLKLEDLFKRVFFGRFVKKEEDNSISQQIDGLEWLMRNTLWLEDYLAFKDSFKVLENKNNVNTKLNFFDNPIFKEFKDNDTKYDCDFTDLDMKYIIVDEFVNTKENGGDDQTYVICGYPDRRMKEIVLNFWQKKEDTEENKEHNALVNALNDIHLDQKGTSNSNSNNISNKQNLQKEIQSNIKLFLKLFAKYNPKKLMNQTYNESDLYMFLKEVVFDYIKKRYDELYSSYSPEDPEYKIYKEYFSYPDNDNGKLNKFKEDATQYFQLIAEKYLPKPITQIKYVFLAFKKTEKDNKVSLEPFIFNVKELKKEHQSILKRIERLIKHELPYRFGILSNDEYKNNTGTEINPFDDEYKLWYSRYRYGKFFHIETEYVHTMSNISDKAHNYKNSITLEELIYSCGLLNDKGNPFFKDLKIDYQVREFQINNYNISYSKNLNNSKKINSSNSKKLLNTGQLLESGSRSNTVFNLYEVQKKETFQISKTEDISKNTQIIKKDLPNFKFILMFKSSIQEYTFIYYYNENFYKLVITSNMKKLIEDIIKNINNINDINDINNKPNLSNNSIKFTELKPLFRIIDNSVLNEKDYNLIFEYNPTFVIKMKRNKDTLVNVFTYYNTELLSSTETIELPNLYLDKSPIYREHFNDAQMLIKTQQNCDKLRIFEDEYSKQLNNKSLIINCVHQNIDNCGYNFWEFLNIKEDKLLIFIVPINENEKTPYLANFIDLNYNNENIKKMLEALIKMYTNNKYLCFFHTSITLKNNTLHFHVVKKIDNYNRSFSNKENQVFILQALYINTVINNLTNCKLYYNNINYDKLKTF